MTKRCGHTIDWYEEVPQRCCIRPTMKESDHCILHTEEVDKAWDDITSEITVSGGSAFEIYVSDIDLTEWPSGLNQLCGSTFKNCSFSGADLVETDLSNSQFINCDFEGLTFAPYSSQGSVFNDTTFFECRIDTFFRSSEWASSELSWCDCSNCGFFEVDMFNTDIEHCSFESVDARKAIFEDCSVKYLNLDLQSSFRYSGFSKCKLEDIDFRETSLLRAQFHHCELSRVDFSGCNLNESSFVSSDASEIAFHGAKIEQADFSDCDLRGADLRDAEIYGAELAQSRISYSTQFDDVLTYERRFRNDRTLFQVFQESASEFSGILPDKTTGRPRRAHSLRRAISSYLELQRVLKTNSIPNWDTDYYIREMECRRLNALWENSYLSWIRLASRRWITKYGTSAVRVFAVSALVIIACGALYPLLGTNISSGGVLSYSSNLKGSVRAFLNSIYFSSVTFTTLGYGDLRPTGLARLLAIAEAFVGTILVLTIGLVLGGDLRR